MASIRTFIAADIPASIRACAEKQIVALQRAGADFRWVKPSNMHLTLRFLGNLLDREIPELCQVVTEAVRQMEPVVVDVRGLGAFPDERHPKVIWLGLGPDLAELQQLHRQIGEGLKRMGFPPERGDFRPHLTLGRIPVATELDDPVADWIAAHAETPFGSFEIDQVIVYSSFLDREGPTYTPMATIDLQG
ncbi:MAG: RNA 2',3'-cyclic phosphodiesterase [Planctomycetota bacterium]|nr:RNA 2',3'-cyclic phosphodiesterase [Blastopirellula sp.]